MRRAVAVTLVDQVTAAIQRAILTGELQPGETLTLRDLAAQLGVSTLPVREAVWRLTAQRLLNPPVGRGGARVPPLDLADLHGIYRLRLVVEPELASRSCLLLAEAELDAVAEIARSFASLDPDMAYQARRDLHLRLLPPAITPWDLRILENLWLGAGRYIHLSDGCRANGHGGRERAYHDLVAAFRTRDPGIVAAKMRWHLELLQARAHDALTSWAGVSPIRPTDTRPVHHTAPSTAAFAATSRHSAAASEE